MIGFFDVGTLFPDLKIENGQIAQDPGLETPALISLYTNRLVEERDLPSGVPSNGGGWWGDDFSDPPEDLIGSRIWTLSRGKIFAETANSLRDYLAEAFQWTIDDGLARTVRVDTEVVSGQLIQGTVQIERPEGDDIPLKFAWDGQELRRL